ncbi:MULTISPECIES: glycosyltransferase family 2 protein [Okeania]|uniref:Glycosyltransferase n=1 Tax=Okeania hirsuta TaxID=1458930 RepID=A0A3N6PZ19_9CYAN|nr:MULTISPECIES: glycosyltransferase family 2 protein [Okeania]NET12869.1 glycosyltransferase family 2 protein [Okeania sp. SIO1H6]NES77930.1 glycosyltransferase family 2 protein [Okeania sp. SIO1H4]NES91191.1 glycosyltransferase family 2 protein [Okeania sp. SIO2B9]NET21459.1 glycosyltransferase family 2 protein [Okeania sp. SIO1H5]NET76369.1 glycosyltransferase family 2 protein [Okeania sp. SIO1F9]
MLSEEKKVQLSIVIPFYNEEPNIDYLFERLISVLKPLEMTYEIICINDGSKDNTLKLLVEYHQRNSLIKVVNFSRNFGKEIAITAGIDYTVGDAVIPIDADLQDPPELIVEMIAKWREGYDVVYATRRSRQGESWIKKFTAQRFYRTIQRLTPVEIPPDTGDFRLMDRKVVEALKKLPETNRFMKGLFSWVGYQQTSILYDRGLRFKGETKWNYWQLWNLAIEGITAFSSIPLKIWSYIGISISLISFIYASFLVIRTLIFGIDVPGYASLIVAILFLGGMQLLSLGILGEYLGRVHEEVKRRPLYLVRESYGFENQMTRSE